MSPSRFLKKITLTVYHLVQYMFMHLVVTSVISIDPLQL